MSKLKQVTITLNAGSRESYGFKGNYLRLVTSLAGVNIKTENDDDFNIQNGNDVVFEDTDFYRIELTSLSGLTEAITIMVGENVKFSAPTVSGSVSILGTPTVIVSGEIKNKANDFTKSYYIAPTVDVSALTAITIIPVADNTNGIEIVSLSAYTYNGSVMQRSALIAKNVAPANMAAGQNFIAAATNGDFYSRTSKAENIKLPAGLGVFYISEQYTTAAYFSAHALIRQL